MVWAALMETRQLMEEYRQESEKRISEIETVLDKGNSDRFDFSHIYAEGPMSTDKLIKIFADIGYSFDLWGDSMSLFEDGKLYVSSGPVLENSDVALIVEEIHHSTIDGVKNHLKRMDKICQHRRKHGVKKTFISAITDKTMSEDVRDFAHGQGFFVVIQTGDSISIAPIPEGFKPREW